MTAMRDDRGQAMVLFALMLMVLFGVGALVVDGGYGFVQLRQAQNAADLASQAATLQLQSNCGGVPGQTDAQLSAVIADVVGANAPRAAANWQGTFLDQGGNPIAGSPALPNTGAQVPSGACGVRVVVSPHWSSILAEVLGVTALSAQARAAAVIGGTPQGPPVGHSAGIVALAPSGEHTIWGGGAGQFIIHGDIMDDSAGNCSSPGCYADTVDDFGSSGTQISGRLESVAPVALDPCFAPAGPTSAVCARHTSGEIIYSGGMVGQLPYEPDPLAYVPVPTAADTACPGRAIQTFTSSPGANFSPGVYNYPVYVTTAATFSDCGGAPGIYIFNDGLQICPGAGETVTGSDIMLYNDAAPPGGGPGPGGSGPCGSEAKGAGPGSGPDGIYIGGQGAVTLSGAAAGLFAHMLLCQDRTVATNIGLDNHSSDGASINLTGAIYDNSESGGTGGVMVSGGGSGGGEISVDGIVVVDRFATAGKANVTITYSASQVPGAGAVLVQ